MEIRPLTTDDADVFRAIRLRALAANPEALRVMRANEDARVLYERYGFTEQPDVGPAAPTACADQPCLRLSITPGVQPSL